MNISYVGGHVVANGADIVLELTNAVAAFQHRNYCRFGHEFGAALRKVLIEKPVNMPGGPPSRVALSRMSLGLVEGFFGRSFTVTITASAQPLRLDVDIHKCIGRNIPFFTSVWSVAWLIFEQLSNGTRSAQDGMSEAALAEALVLLPGALRQCNITPSNSQC